MITQSVRQLIRRIHQALEGELSHTELVTLAEEYADTCRQGNQRLDQLLTLIEKGSLYSALQLAEVEPPIMDLVAQLSFSDSLKWRDLCVTQRLSVPEKLNESAVRQVSELYHNKTLDTSFLYREYRACILQKEHGRALHCLRAILRMNPADQNARDEAHRLQDRHLQESLQQLAKALDARDGKRIQALMEEIESFPDVSPERSPVWVSALKWRRNLEADQARIRMEQLTVEINRLALEEDHERLLQRKKAWDQLAEQAQHVDSGVQRSLRELEFQSEQALAERQSVRRQEGIADAWYRYLKEIEVDLRDRLTPAACRERLARISEYRRSLLSEGAQGDRDLETLATRLEQTLHRRIQYRRQARYLQVITLSLLVIGVLVGTFVFWQQRSHLQHAVQRMSAALEQRDIHQTRLILDAWERESTDFLQKPEIAALAQQAREWVERETRHEERVQRLYLRARHAIESDPTQVTQILEDLDEAKTLYEGLRTHSQERIDFERREVLQLWERARVRWIEEDRNKLEQMRLAAEELWSNRIEKASLLGQMRRDLSLIDHAVTEAQTVLTRIQLLTHAADSRISYWTELQQRSAQLAVILDTFFQVESTLNGDVSLDSQRKAVLALASLPFTHEPLVIAAREIQPTVVQWDEPGAALLDSGGLSAVKGQASVVGTLRFYPDRLNPAENLRLRELLEQSIALKLFRYDLESWQAGERVGNRSRLLTLGEITSRANPPYGDREQIIQTLKLVTSSSVLQEPWYQEAEYIATRLIGTGSWREGSTVMNGHRLPEGEFLERFKGQLGYDSGSGQIGRPLLYALDELFREQTLDPVFKAWLFAEFVRVGMTRPAEWGLLAAPSVLKDWDRLQLLYGGVPSFTDWLDPVRQEQLRARAEFFFKNQSVPSYMRQAAFHAQLTNLLGSSKWDYQGYVRVDGTLYQVAADAGQSREKRYLWGINRDKQWVSLYEYTENRWDIRGVSQPLTPLFYFSGDIHQYVKDAGEQVGVRNEEELQVLRGYLPEYFR